MNTIQLAALGTILSLSTQAPALQIGAWVGSASDTSQDGTYPQPTDANVKAFAQLQGRKLDFVQYFANWPASWTAVKRYADIAANNGATLMVTWQPSGYTAPQIVAGKADAYLGRFAREMKSYPHDVWLRPLHEANGGDWYSWNVGNSSMANTEEDVAAAFRHIVKIFRDSGGTNVKWVWNVNNENASGGNSTSFTGTYPGDEWVDYISIDGYNFGTFHTVANSGWKSSWRTFVQAYKPAYTALSKIDKPIFVAEFSSSELGGDKAQWYRDAFASLSTTFPRFFALMVFSMNDANGDWRINTTDASLQAWKECVAKYAPVTTGVGASAPHASSFVRASGEGLVRIESRGEEHTRIDVRDIRGTLLEHRDLGALEAGSHEVDLGRSGSMRLVEVFAGARREAILLGAL